MAGQRKLGKSAAATARLRRRQRQCGSGSVAAVAASLVTEAAACWKRDYGGSGSANVCGYSEAKATLPRKKLVLHENGTSFWTFP